MFINKMKGVRGIIVAALVVTSQLVIAQIVGGRENGQEVPHEVKPSDLSIGNASGGVDPFSGGVDPFSGGVNYNQQLGAVSTPAGLAYPVNLSYSTVSSTGSLMPHMSGIPYGEGWSVSIPSIRVSGSAYNDITVTDPAQAVSLATHDKKTKEGELKWLRPVINIPGLISEEFVYKYFSDGKHIFVPRKFDTYVEAHFNGYMWEVLGPDGTLYVFDMRQESTVAPSNQRVPGDYNHAGEYTDSERDELENLLMPKTKVTAWYITEISNPVKFTDGERIVFEYETFGKVNYFKEFAQPNLRALLYNEFYTELSPDPIEFYTRKECKTYEGSTDFITCLVDVSSFLQANNSTFTTLDYLCLDYTLSSGVTEVNLDCKTDLEVFFNGGFEGFTGEAKRRILTDPASNWMYSEEEMKEYEDLKYGSINMFKDVFLKNVKARNNYYIFEELDLEYEHFDADAYNGGVGYNTTSDNGLEYSPEASRMLLTSDPEVALFDNLYGYKSVLYRGLTNSSDKFVHQGSGTSFSDWKRYRHLISDKYIYEAGEGYFYGANTINRDNPYVCADNYNGDYLYPDNNEPTTGGNALSFDHSFLQSPRFNNTNFTDIESEFIPGEEYELRTKIEVPFTLDPRAVNFDINIATGDASSLHNYDDLHQFIPSGIYNPSAPSSMFNFDAPAPTDLMEKANPAMKSETIFTTFNNAIKWNNMYQTNGAEIYTANRFVMPDIPSDYEGFDIQIGPANSDNDFSMGPKNGAGVTSYVNGIAGYATNPDFTFDIASSWYTYYLTNSNLERWQYNSTNQSLVADRDAYYKPTPNFGIGLPWSQVAGFAHRIFYGMNDPSLPELGFNSPFYNFWSNVFAKPGVGVNGDLYLWPNKPTAADADVQLQGMELVRHGKTPYMLRRANFYQYNGEAKYSEVNDLGPNLGRHLSVSHEINYDITQIQVNNFKKTPQPYTKADGSTGYVYTVEVTPKYFSKGGNVYPAMRNIFLLKSITRKDRYNSCTNCPTQTFAYERYDFDENNFEGYDHAEIYAKGSVILMAGSTDHLGKEVTYDYYSLGDEPTRYIVTNKSERSNLKTASSTQDPVAIGPEVTLQIYPAVQQEGVFTQHGWNYTIYEYTNGRILTENAGVFPSNSVHTSTNPQSSGFEQVKVILPKLNSESANDFALYEFSHDPFKFGKMLKMENFASDNARLDKTEYTYQVSKAYDNYFSRKVTNLQYPTGSKVFKVGDDKEYGNYADYYYGVSPINQNGYALRMYVLSDRDNEKEVIKGYSYGASFFVRLIQEKKTVYDYCDATYYVEDDGGGGTTNPGSGVRDVAIVMNRSDVEKINPSVKGEVYKETVKNLNDAVDQEVIRQRQERDKIIAENPDLEEKEKSLPAVVAAAEDQVRQKIGFVLGGNTYAVNVMETITDYEYFDGNEQGMTNSDGYKYLLDKKDDLGNKFAYISLNTSSWNNEYNFEPSWNLYSTTQYSPQLPGLKNKTEYFYYWDQRKLEGIFNPEEINTVELDGISFFARIYKNGARTEGMQTRKTTWNYGSVESVNNEYYIYGTSFEPVPPGFDIYHILADGSIIKSEAPDEDGPQPEETEYEFDPLNYEDRQLDYAGTLAQPFFPACADIKPVPTDVAYECVVISELNAKTFVNDDTKWASQQFDNPLYAECGHFGQIEYKFCKVKDPVGSEKPIKTISYLSEIHRNKSKASTRPNDDLPIMKIHIGTDNKPVYDYGYREFTAVKMENRNYLGLYNKITDSRGMVTDYSYDIGKTNYYKDLENVDQSYRLGEMKAPGKPLKIIIAEGTTASQTSKFAYNDVLLIDTIIDTNNVEGTYEYDEFNRLTSISENDVKLKSYSYHFWDGQLSDNFEERMAKNYVESTTYLDSDPNVNNNVKRSYVNPLKQAIQSISYTSGTSNPTTKLIYSGETTYDNWGRAIRSYRPFETTFAGNIAPLSAISLEYKEAVYEENQRSLLLKEFKPGESITKNHGVIHERCFISWSELRAELGLSASEMVRITTTSSGNVKPHVFKKHKVVDEDGKINIAYIDVMGRTVANKSALSPTEDIVTWFIYDTRGNVVESVNSKGQNSVYLYNTLGQMYYEETVDGGVKKFIYNVSGDLVAQEDGNLRTENMTRITKYDLLGRPIEQGKYPKPNGTFNFSRFATDELLTLDKTAKSFGVGLYYNMDVNNLSLIMEKKWFYDNTEATTIPYEMDDYLIENYVPFQDKNQGKLSFSESYKVDGQVSVSVLKKVFAYNNRGQLSLEFQQFNPNGLSLTAQGKGTGIWYNNYDTQGNLVDESVDFNNDLIPDVQHYFVFDDWNRLKNVYFNFGNQGLAGNKLIELDYDDANGLMTGKKYFMKLNGVETLLDDMSYSYDIRERMTSMESKFFNYSLKYDSDIFIGGVSQNRNGNINGVQAIYDFTTAINDPGNFSTTTFSYQYDNLNRLILAKDNTYGGNSYSYDVLGNLVHISRQFADKREDLNMTFSTGKNQMTGYQKTITPVGANVSNLSKSFEYDLNGNLIEDNSRNITNIKYERANLPIKIEDQTGQEVNYIYDERDQRIYKDITDASLNVDAPQFYLRDAMGRELGIMDLENDEWVMNLYADNRFARVNIDEDNLLTLNEVPKAPDYIDEAKLSTGQQIQQIMAVLQKWRQDGYDFPGELVSIKERDIYTGELAENVEFLMRTTLENRKVNNSNYQFDEISSTAIKNDKEIIKIPGEGGKGNNGGDVGPGAPGVIRIPVRALIQEALPNPQNPDIPGLNTGTPDDFNGLRFYVYDHLGNTRVTYGVKDTDDSNSEFDLGYQILGAYDYYPYGKVLREYNWSVQEIYLTTQHERDQETGYDYRGARFYDSETGKFLSLDPLASKYPGLSDYNYVAGNPIIFIDEDGRKIRGVRTKNGKITHISNRAKARGTERYIEARSATATGRSQIAKLIEKPYRVKITVTDKILVNPEGMEGNKMKFAKLQGLSARKKWLIVSTNTESVDEIKERGGEVDVVIPTDNGGVSEGKIDSESFIDPFVDKNTGSNTEVGSAAEESGYNDYMKSIEGEDPSQEEIIHRNGAHEETHVFEELDLTKFESEKRAYEHEVEESKEYKNDHK